MWILTLLTSFSVFAFDRSLPLGKSGQLIEREGYSLRYNSDCKTPHWVSYRLTEADLVINVGRTNDFRTDSSLRGPQAQVSDYKGSGYDRGHMARAALFRKSKKLMSETFILSNIVPQHSFMNQNGAWRGVEDFEFDVITRKKDVQIISGPVNGPNDQRIGENEVCVPEYVYKVLYHSGKAIAFMIPNFRTNFKYDAYAMSVDELEELTGLDFLPELDDATEARVERSFDLSHW